MKQIFDWLRKQMQEARFPITDLKVDVRESGIQATDDAVLFERVNEIINEAEAKFGCHSICYLDSSCEYQNEDISVIDMGICGELLDKLVEPSKRCSHGLCELRSHVECVGFEHCENCFVDAIKDLINNSDSRFKKILEVE